jgi:hypothetical protein
MRHDREELVLGHGRRLRRRAHAPLALEVLPLGDVFDGQEDEGWLTRRREHTAGVQAHRPSPERREVVLDLEVFEGAFARQDLLQQHP